VKSRVRIPVIGNGDVVTPPDALALYQQTDCDAVMIGRAAASNPWIFRQLSDFFRTGTFTQPTEADRYQLIRSYYQMLVTEEVPGAIGKMKQFASWFTHGVRKGAELRRSIQSARGAREVLDRVDQFFNPSGSSVIVPEEVAP
jgi:tRNA-dihydrouridine synthase